MVNCHWGSVKHAGFDIKVTPILFLVRYSEKSYDDRSKGFVLIIMF